MERSERWRKMTMVHDHIQDAESQARKVCEMLIEEVSSGRVDDRDGLSLLLLKNQLMVSYMANLVYIMTKKSFGLGIEEESAVDRLVEIRVVLERINPLEQKLKYTIEKLVKAALTGETNENDPTNFRANPDNMADNLDGSESESEEEGRAAGRKPENRNDVYRPPRLAPMHFEEEENATSRRQKQLERAKKRALHSSVVEELKEQYLDTPVELSHGNMLKAQISKHQRQKNQYEEEYFTRLPTSKKEKHRSRHSMTVGNIADHLTHFENIQVLEDEESFTGQKRQRKTAKKQNKKKGGYKRRTIH